MIVTTQPEIPLQDLNKEMPSACEAMFQVHERLKVCAKRRGSKAESYDDFVTDIFRERADEVDTILTIIPPQGQCWTAFVHSGVVFIRPPLVGEWIDDEFKNTIVALLELAEEVLQCGRVVVCLEKKGEELKTLVHAFMYIGFQLVTPDIYGYNDRFILVGYDI
ncbi:uncharacterized protein VTP21DRAFT_886 [Calcarisporiella thermophila]|uniref:uncharacterized protein n=1 Tax=Calcarisporiella thermophila TaxID=911321 RepID=UPI0037442094